MLSVRSHELNILDTDGDAREINRTNVDISQMRFWQHDYTCSQRN